MEGERGGIDLDHATFAAAAFPRPEAVSRRLARPLRKIGATHDETRHVKAALSAMTVKTDRKGARGIAQLIRMGRFRGARKVDRSSRDSGAAGRASSFLGDLSTWN